MTITATSRSGVLIRLTDERWAHIVEEHCELAGLREEVLQTITEAEAVFAGAAEGAPGLADGGNRQGSCGNI